MNAVDFFYDNGELELLRKKTYEVRENQWIETTHGIQEEVTVEEWMNKMCEQEMWVFDSAELRYRILEEAGI